MTPVLFQAMTITALASVVGFVLYFDNRKNIYLAQGVVGLIAIIALIWRAAQ